MRYFLDIAYQGTNYHGWQIQNNAHSIQAEIQGKLSLLLHQPTEIIASGRTDTGVHAEQQIAHFDTSNTLNPKDILYKLNAILPIDIAVKAIYQVSDEAHARFDAHKRTYEYRMSTVKTPFLNNLYFYYKKELDIEKMNEAAKLLFEYTDFQSFSKVKTDVKTFICYISKAEWYYDNNILIFKISANRFLRGMVRAIVGTLLEVGLHKLNLDELRKVIQSRDRRLAGWAVPPQGLFLTKVEYPYDLVELGKKPNQTKMQK